MKDYMYPNENEYFRSMLESDCHSCLCTGCNENNANGGDCNQCTKCEEKPITLCPISKYHDVYGDGQGN